MTIAVGTFLGPYEILALIGRGGPPPLAQFARASFDEIAPEPSQRMRL